MKYSEIIADNVSKAGWSLGYVSALDSRGRIILIADAHRGDGERSLCAWMKAEPLFWNSEWGHSRGQPAHYISAGEAVGELPKVNCVSTNNFCPYEMHISLPCGEEYPADVLQRKLVCFKLGVSN